MTGFDLKKRERGHGEVVCLCRGVKDGESYFSGSCIIQIYVDDNGDKVGVVEKGEHIEFVNAVDFDSVSDFLHVFDSSHLFDFSDFSIFRCL